MKCIACGKDNNYATRKKNNYHCDSCHHAFAFEPKDDSLGVTDGLFQRVIEDVSGKGRLFFTQRQLWQQFNRRLARKKLFSFTDPKWWLGVLIFTAIAGFFVVGSWSELSKVSSGKAPGWGGYFGGAFAIVFIWLAARGLLRHWELRSRLRQQGYLVDFVEFRAAYLKRWLAANGSPAKMIDVVEESLPRTIGAGSTAPKAAAEPDITAYSFDRVVVTDQAETAAFLLANNFHFENNCAVLSIGGYPAGIAQTVLGMLRSNPSLLVFAVHDASPQGCGLPLALRHAGSFPDPSVTIVDLGLRPRHVRALRVPALPGWPAVLPDDVRRLLTPQEVTWLEQGNRVELAAMPPARLLRSVYQGLALARRSEKEPAGGDTGGGVWVYDGNADIHAADSFG